MKEESPAPTRFIGLDIHKHYLVAVGVDPDAEQVLGPQRVSMQNLESWIDHRLEATDAVVIEMTTNTWQVHDDLLPRVHSVTVVHPPHVKLITRAHVMTDRIAALNLAKLHAKGLLTGIWVPPQEVRELRALIAQRAKMSKLSVQARNRLHSTLHRRHLLFLEKGSPFHPDYRSWWLKLPLTTAEKVCVLSDLETLDFAQKQIDLLTNTLNEIAGQDERVPLLVQVTGINILSAMTILGAIGTIERFPDAKKLVGYAGLGARIHDSGQTRRSGGITKTGRRDLRATMIEIAWTAVRHDAHWKAEFKRLEFALGRNKAVVAVARKMLVAVWHILTKKEAFRFVEPERTARKLLQFAYRLGADNRSAELSTKAYVRQILDRLGICRELTCISWGGKKRPILLPPSGLPAPGD